MSRRRLRLTPSGTTRNRVLAGATVGLLLLVAVAVVLGRQAQPSRAERVQAFLLAVRSAENPEPEVRRYAAADLVGLGEEACAAARTERSIPGAAQSLATTGMSFDAAVFMTVAATRSLCPGAV